MFSKSKARFIIVIATIMIAILGATLLIIYTTTKLQTARENKEMLNRFAAAYEKNGFPDESMVEIFPVDKSIASHKYNVTTFYAVSFNKDGDVLDILNDIPAGFSDEMLIEFAKNIKKQGVGYGESKDITYLITEGDDYVLVTMMDTVVIDSAIKYLMQNMIIFGAIATAVVCALAIFLSNWIMQPVKEAYKKQKQFISDAGHELKTPISTIGANLEILQRDIGSNKWLDNISYENTRMSVLVHQLLDLARIENATLNKEELNLSQLALASIMPFEATAFERGIQLDYEIEENITIEGDKSALEKLISILIDNAISNCSDKGNVNAILKKESGRVKLQVNNTGDEISAEDISHLFERFYKSDKSRKEDKGHYGLGLSIAKAIVDEHKGKIEVECKKGVVEFSVVL